VNRQPGLDLLRAIAIVWVMLFHSFLVGGLGPQFGWLSRFGWAGVDIFFVLSGFLIGSQLLRPLQRGERVSLAKFYERRAWRILPAFAVVLALYSAIPSLREVPGMQPWWQFATFTVNLLIDYERHPAFSHAWSLCVEEHFYLLFPLLAVAMSRRASPRAVVALGVGVLLGGTVLRGAVWLHDTTLDTGRNWFIEDLYDPTWMRLDGLLAGVMLATVRVYRPQWWSRWQSRAGSFALGGLALTACALWLFRDRTGLAANTVGWPLLSTGFACLLVAASTAQWLQGRWWMRPLSWIATISYSLYLVHKIAYHLVQVHVAPLLGDAGGLRFAAYGLGALAAGALLHYAVERPFLRWRDRRTAGDHPARWRRQAATGI